MDYRFGIVKILKIAERTSFFLKEKNCIFAPQYQEKILRGRRVPSFYTKND